MSDELFATAIILAFAAIVAGATGSTLHNPRYTGAASGLGLALQIISGVLVVATFAALLWMVWA